MKEVRQFLKKKTTKEFLIYGIGNIANSSIGFILLPIYLKYLSPSEFGVVSLLLILQSAFSMIAISGTLSGLYRLYYEHDEDGQKKIVTSLMLWVFTMSVLLGILTIVFSKELAPSLFLNNPRALQIFVLYTLFATFLMIPLNLVRLERKPATYVLFSIANFFIDFLLKFLFIAYLKRGFIGYLESSLITAFAMLFLVSPFILKYLKPQDVKKSLKKLLTLGLPYLFSTSCFWVIELVDRFFLNHYYGAETVGIYSLASRIASIFTVVVYTPFSQFWTPFVFSQYAKEGELATKNILKKVLPLIIFAGGSIVLFILVGSKEIISLMTNNASYDNVYKLVPLLVLSPFIYLICVLPDASILASKKVKLMAIIYVVGSIANLCLNILLIPHLGAMGAAIATFATYIILMVLYFYWGQKTFYVEYSTVKPILTLFVLTLLFFALDLINLKNVIAELVIRELSACLLVCIAGWVLFLNPMSFFRKLRKKILLTQS